MWRRHWRRHHLLEDGRVEADPLSKIPRREFVWILGIERLIDLGAQDPAVLVAVVPRRVPVVLFSRGNVLAEILSLRIGYKSTR